MLRVLSICLMFLILVVRPVSAQRTDTNYVTRPVPANSVGVGLHTTSRTLACTGASGPTVFDSSGNAYVLMNNHIAGLNNATGVQVDQPGPATGGQIQFCSQGDGTLCGIGTVDAYAPLSFDYDGNAGDWALVRQWRQNNGAEDAINTIYGHGEYLSSVPVLPYINASVGFVRPKTGRIVACTVVATGVAERDWEGPRDAQGKPCDPATGEISGTNVSCTPEPKTSCNSSEPVWAGYQNQIFLDCHGYGGEGDSGATVFTLTDACRNPIATIHSGGDFPPYGAVEIAAPINPGLDALRVFLKPAPSWSGSCVSADWTPATANMEDASIKPVDYMDEAAVSEYDQLAQSLNDPRANPTRDKDIKDWEQALGHPLTAGPLPVYVDSTGKAFDPKRPYTSYRLVVAVEFAYSNQGGMKVPDADKAKLPKSYKGYPLTIYDAAFAGPFYTTIQKGYDTK
jgi:hypothetical protein